MPVPDQRFIVLWRETGERCLDWQFHVCESEDEAKRVVTNITERGVIQYSTHTLGARLVELSAEF